MSGESLNRYPVLAHLGQFPSAHEQCDAGNSPTDKTTMFGKSWAFRYPKVDRGGPVGPLPYGRGSDSPLPHGRGTDPQRGSDWIDGTDRQIDHLVNELYGLSDEGIRIVEGATSQ